jgi:hypothetical protein
MRRLQRGHQCQTMCGAGDKTRGTKVIRLYGAPSKALEVYTDEWKLAAVARSKKGWEASARG